MKAKTQTPAVSQPTAQPTAAQTSAISPTLVVFGRDAAGKPHASAFPAGEAALATKAAGLMGLRTLTVHTELERALAARVPAGRVFASGRAFVPFITADLLAELQAAALHNGLPTLAVVAGSNAADSTPAQAAKPAPAAAAPVAVKQPCGWGEIAVGAIVLSSAAPKYLEWYECQVVAVLGEDQFTLRYCDFPNEPAFARRRSEIGLLHPAYTPEPPLAPEPVGAAA